MGGKKVLIVDENPDVMESMKLILKAYGYQIFEASNSNEGLKKITEINPDLVILDVITNGNTEGFRLSHKLRTPDPEYAAYSKIPILMLAVMDRARYTSFSPKTGGDYLPADGLVEIPVSPHVIVEKLKELIGE